MSQKSKQKEKKINYIGDLLEAHIQQIIDKNYPPDPRLGDVSCNSKPTFIISQMGSNIFLTLTHIGWSHSDIIGFETNIEDLVTDLYNRTL